MCNNSKTKTNFFRVFLFEDFFVLFFSFKFHLGGYNLLCFVIGGVCCVRSDYCV